MVLATGRVQGHRSPLDRTARTGHAEVGTRCSSLCPNVGPVIGARFWSALVVRVQHNVGDLLGPLAVVQEPPAPRRRDVWIAGGLFVLAGLELGAEDTVYRFPSARFLLALALCVGVPWRRAHPLWIAVGGLGGQTLLDVVTAADGAPDSGTPGGQTLAALLIVYALTRWAPGRDVAIGFCSVLVFAVISEIAASTASELSLATVSPWLLAGLIGLVLRYRSALQTNRVAQARLHERNRLARELHDSVAHHVSAIAVQAQAAQFIAPTDPAAAVTAMREVEATANRAIDEMRHMVGVLRSDADIARSVPHDSLDDLAEPEGRPPVVVIGHTDLSDLPPSIGAALYRVAQESITNARKHARGATFVEIATAIGPDALVMTVVNDGLRPSGFHRDGYGLIGMDERLHAVGGTLRAGPLADQGWKVEARIPLPGTGGKGLV